MARIDHGEDSPAVRRLHLAKAANAHLVDLEEILHANAAAMQKLIASVAGTIGALTAWNKELDAQLTAALSGTPPGNETPTPPDNPA